MELSFCMSLHLFTIDFCKKWGHKWIFDLKNMDLTWPFVRSRDSVSKTWISYKLLSGLGLKKLIWDILFILHEILRHATSAHFITRRNITVERDVLHHTSQQPIHSLPYTISQHTHGLFIKYSWKYKTWTRKNEKNEKN